VEFELDGALLQLHLELSAPPVVLFTGAERVLAVSPSTPCPSAGQSLHAARVGGSARNFSMTSAIEPALRRRRSVPRLRSG